MPSPKVKKKPKYRYNFHSTVTGWFVSREYALRYPHLTTRVRVKQ